MGPCCLEVGDAPLFTRLYLRHEVIPLPLPECQVTANARLSCSAYLEVRIGMRLGPRALIPDDQHLKGSNTRNPFPRLNAALADRSLEQETARGCHSITLTSNASRNPKASSIVSAFPRGAFVTHATRPPTPRTHAKNSLKPETSGIPCSRTSWHGRGWFKGASMTKARKRWESIH
jgi:hypothetical protein